MEDKNDELLCNYIFGLLNETDSLSLENELKDSPELSQRLSELNEVFCGLDTVKNDYPNPVSQLLSRLCRISCAGTTVASAMVLFWATVFGHASNEFIKTSSQSESALVKPAGVSCISGIDHSEESECSYAGLASFRE